MLLVPLGLTSMLFVKDLVQDAFRMVCLTLTFPRFLTWDLGGHGGRVPCGRKQHVWGCASAAGQGLLPHREALCAYIDLGRCWKVI